MATQRYPTNAEVAMNVGSLLSQGVSTWANDREQKAAEQTIMNPDSTPIQKALAWEKIHKGGGLKSLEMAQKDRSQAAKTDFGNKFDYLMSGKTPPIRMDENANISAGVAPSSAVDTAKNAIGGQAPLPNEPTVTQPASTDLQEEEAETMASEGLANPKRLPKEVPGLQNYSIEELQNLLKEAKDVDAKGPVAAIQDELRRRDTQLKNEGALDKERLREKNKVAAENRAAIKELKAPYKDMRKLRKHVKDAEKARNIILNSGKFSFDETWFRGALSAIADVRGYEAAKDILQTPEQQMMFSLLYDQLRPKELGGSNPSTKEVILSMSKLPNPYKGKAANAYIIGNILKDAKLQEYQGKVMNDISLEYGDNISEAQFTDILNNKLLEKADQLDRELENEADVVQATELMKERTQKPGHIWALTPTKDLIQIPAQDRIKAQASGLTILTGTQ